MKSNSRRTNLVIALFLCSLAIFAIINTGLAVCTPPQMKVASIGDDGQHSQYITATWTQPSGCTGSFKVLEYVHVTGTYITWIEDNTAGGFALDHTPFNSTKGCDQAASAPSASLTAGHSYTMYCDISDGGGGHLDMVYAETRIFAQCQGN